MAVTVNENAVPPFAVAGAETPRCVAPADATTMAALVPVMAALTVSVAVMVWLPAVVSVAGNVATPLVSVASAGSVAAASELVKWTVPAYPVAVAFDASSAVTVMLNALPATVEATAE